MTKVVNGIGKEIDFEAAVNLMDDEIREALHRDGIESEQDFFDAYCRAHAEKYGEDFAPNTNEAW